MLTLEQVQEMIKEECDGVKELLLLKNREYGNAALEPINVFSGTRASDQIKVRIDDKLSRIKATSGMDTVIKEDTVQDLIGYLVLYRVALRTERDY